MAARRQRRSKRKFYSPSFREVLPTNGFFGLIGKVGSYQQRQLRKTLCSASM
jgi:hypothetical protein